MGSVEFRFRQFTIQQPRAAMRVGTDGVLLGAWARADAPKRILDIGTGTGLIALMMAQRFPAAEVNAVEVEEGARLDALENFSRSSWADRIRIVGYDILDFAASQPAGGYDLIVCNPPFFRDSLPNARNVYTLARHQGELRVETLFKAARHLLGAEGTFSMVYPHEGLSELRSVALSAGLFLKRWCEVRSKLDKPWSRVLSEWTPKQQTAIHESHVLMDEHGSGYSKEHRDLTRDFYL